MPKQQSTNPVEKHTFKRYLTGSAVMDRDRRLTGNLRGQTDEVDAPPGFELNSAWRVGDFPTHLYPMGHHCLQSADGGTVLLERPEKCAYRRWAHPFKQFNPPHRVHNPLAHLTLAGDSSYILQIHHQPSNTPSLLRRQPNPKPPLQRLHSLPLTPTPSQLLGNLP